ncbi:MAG: alpha/beta fold hydrolase [Elusimicrobiota bacterium]|jgi:dipeptidyl aminopeptidase/acylaminoacyl peptidase
MNALLLLLLAWAVPVTAASPAPPPESLALRGVPAIPAEVSESAGRYQNARSAWFLDWDPGGKGMLIATRFGDTAQLHKVAFPMAARTQLTFHDEPVSWGRFRPDPSKPGFVFSKDEGGSEAYQVHWFDAKRSSAVMLTDGASRNIVSQWSRKADRLAFSSTRRNGRDFDIHIVSPEAPGGSRLVLQTTGQWTVTDWSPDDAKLLLLERLSARDARLHILDLASGRVVELMPHPGRKVSLTAAQWSADMGSVYFLSDEWGEFMELGRLDLTSGSVERLTRGIPWDVEDFELSPDGKLLAYLVNEEGLSRLKVLATRDLKPLRLPPLPMGEASGPRFTPDSRHLGLTLSTPRSAGDAYSIDLKKGVLTAWTASELGGLDAAAFVEPELIRYPTFDRDATGPRSIPAFVYRPREGHHGPRPVLISIHGGPEGQERPSFSSQYQYWVKELGIVVIAPNVRGSDGYGKTYMGLDDGFKREDSVKDIGALLDWIAAQPDLDPGRVGVYGGSYGGYMVLACMARFPDRIKAGVDSVGISNFVTFLENTQAYRRDIRRAEYGDERDPKMRAFLQSISPTTLVGSIRGSLMVSQGANDPRVPASEAEQIVSAVEKNGSQVWYILGKDEGHGFGKKRNLDYFRDAVSLFLQRNLIGP